MEINIAPAHVIQYEQIGIQDAEQLTATCKRLTLERMSQKTWGDAALLRCQSLLPEDLVSPSDIPGIASQQLTTQVGRPTGSTQGCDILCLAASNTQDGHSEELLLSPLETAHQEYGPEKIFEHACQFVGANGRRQVSWQRLEASIPVLKTDEAVLEKVGPIHAQNAGVGEFVAASTAFFPAAVAPGYLGRVDILLTGQPRIYIVISHGSTKAFEAAVEEAFPGEHRQSCSQWLGHKQAIPTLPFLRSKGIRYSVIEQNVGDAVVVFPGVYCFGLCTGEAYSQTTNFVRWRWEPFETPFAPCIRCDWNTTGNSETSIEPPGLSESEPSSPALTATPITPNDGDAHGDATRLEKLLDNQVRQALDRAKSGDDVYKHDLTQIVEDAWSLLRG